MPIITEEIIKQGMSLNGSWNIAQLKAILPAKEFDRPYAWPSNGWKRRLIGSEVSQEKIDEFLRLKNRHLAHKTKYLPKLRQLEPELFSHMKSIKQEIKNACSV
jgi:hypothetical protein